MMPLWPVHRMLLVVAVASAASAVAAEVTPVLKEDPQVVEKLRHLGANQGVLLGKARVVGEFNDVARKYKLHVTGPLGRDYSIKMVWAPERRRALFCGANHGTPHRLNDVWEFDLEALAWVLLYPPDNPRSYGGLGSDYSDVEFRDGVLRTRRGGPAVIGHTWWGLTYDPEGKRLLYMNTWVADVGKAVALVGGDETRRYTGPPLWAFTPQSGEWQPVKTPPPAPKAPFGGMLEYVPDLGGAIWHMNNWQMRATWLYDPGSNTWKDLGANGPGKDFGRQAPGREQVGYFDPVRGILVAQVLGETFHFEPKRAAWRKVAGERGAQDAPAGHDARAPMYYDPASGHGLLVDFKTDTLWAYDPDSFKWTRLQPAGDPMPRGKKRLAYFDPASNVMVVIDGTSVWAYRYARGKSAS